jgi:hypothetical protein
MSQRAKKEYLGEIRYRYRLASKQSKKLILDEFCEVCGYNRKYAIRLLNDKPVKADNWGRKRGRKPVYEKSEIIMFLETIWKATNLMCSKRLKAAIPLWIDWYVPKDSTPLEEEIKKHILKISPATIDRLLKKNRKKYNKKGFCTTKPGRIIRQFIPIKTNQWDETKPGFVEADTVAHCGGSMAGDFIFTLDIVDIATGWTTQRAVWGKGETGVFSAMMDIERTLPFKIKGFDSDNGGEFLNWRLLKYFKERKRPVQFTRSREYNKNDNAHIEEKNWTVVRQYIGYERLDKKDILDMMNDLYTKEFYCFINFFKPSVKLKSKIRIRSKIIKKYHPPKTPYHRLMESPEIPKKTKLILTSVFKKLNPFKLEKTISEKINRIMNLAIR